MPAEITTEVQHSLSFKLPSGLTVTMRAGKADCEWLQAQLNPKPATARVSDRDIDAEWLRCKKGSVAAFRHAVRWAEEKHGY